MNIIQIARLAADFSLPKIKKLKSLLCSRFYAKARNEWRGSSTPSYRQGNTAPKKRSSGGEPLATRHPL